MIDAALKNACILLVDDEGVLLNDLAAFLREQGIRVDTATSGKIALERIAEQPYTLVVTDIRMPDLSGIDLLRRIKEDHPDIAVILITGYASAGSAIEALRLGAYDYLEKPFEMLELLQTIVNALEHAELKRKNEALVEELQAHQRSLERHLENQAAETAEMRDRLAQYETRLLHLETHLDALHDAADAIRDSADACRQSGRGYPGVVNRLIRTCLRKSRTITEILTGIEERPQEQPVDVPSMPVRNEAAVAEPADEFEGLPDFELEALYARLYTCVESVMNAQQTDRRLDPDPVFALMEAVTERPHTTDGLYRKAIQAPENSDDFGFAASVIHHSVNVTIYALKLAEGFQYTRDQQIELGVAALLHDIGMADFPTDFFGKTKLDARDRERLGQHPVQARAILQSLGAGYQWLVDTVYQEHEREDGSGYPQGLGGEHIHPYAKLIGLADTYAGLTRARPERPGYLPFEAVKEIADNHRAKFNSGLLRVLIAKLSTFPFGSMVRLNSGAVGKVVETDEAYPLRPTLQIVRNPQGQPVSDKRILHLRDHPVLYITDVVRISPRHFQKQAFEDKP